MLLISTIQSKGALLLLDIFKDKNGSYFNGLSLLPPHNLYSAVCIYQQLPQLFLVVPFLEKQLYN